ncbi:unnamed protein product [Medioppia subpectinata]|uniref:Cytochrome P450 n=1 Tax=Medioppia subpectinata TaxID=1979941 RepID=A0A7R9LSS3_9ACAR|nr:unnamed protein product [Medioppia subpectinata]CAG2120860.1 unnamed protein product [Medioppia subpectinata]
MANNRQMQIRLRDEIESVIGDRMATHEDRNRCHYVNAFIAETLRYRPVAPGGVPHTAMCDTHLVIVGNLLANSMDANLWSNPHTFDPDRFLNQDGTLVAHVPGYVAFGVGHRSCLGEKLATAELFLVVAHLIKYTAGRVFALETGKGDGSADLEMAADQLVTSRPKPYKIMLLPCA